MGAAFSRGSSFSCVEARYVNNSSYIWLRGGELGLLSRLDDPGDPGDELLGEAQKRLPPRVIGESARLSEWKRPVSLISSILK